MQEKTLPNREGLRPASAGRGFTLFEMMISLAIMSIMGMIAIPQLIEATKEYRLTAIAREVSGNISNTRILAITQNTDYRVLVSGSDTYIVQEDVAGTWTDRTTFTMPDGFTIGADGSVVEFHRWGNAAPVATFSITNENSTVAQVVTATSGRSHVQ